MNVGAARKDFALDLPQAVNLLDHRLIVLPAAGEPDKLVLQTRKPFIDFINATDSTWNDADNVRRQILEIPGMVTKDERYINAMKNSDKQNARMESERALQSVIFSIMADNMELFKQFNDNPSFKKWLSDLVFNLTYNPEGKPFETPSNDSNNK